MLKSISIDILLHNVKKKEPRKTKWAVSWSWFFPTRKRCSTNGPTLDFHKSEELDFISMVVAESTNHRVTCFFSKTAFADCWLFAILYTIKAIDIKMLFPQSLITCKCLFDFIYEDMIIYHNSLQKFSKLERNAFLNVVEEAWLSCTIDPVKHC